MQQTASRPHQTGFLRRYLTLGGLILMGVEETEGLVIG